MIDYLKRFWALLVSFAGVAGLYLAAEALKLTKFFWVVIAIAAIVAGIRPAVRGLGEIVVRIRNYPALLKRAAQAEGRVHDLETAQQHLEEAIKDAKEEGRTDAFTKVQGAILAAATRPPIIMGIADEEGVIALLGKHDPGSAPPIGARYSVVSTSTGSCKGYVEVARLDGKEFVWMTCVEPTIGEFWRHLAERVPYDDSPPTNVTLGDYSASLKLPIFVDETNNGEIHEVTKWLK